MHDRGEKIMAEVIINGSTYDFDAAVNMMDNDIRESIHAEGIEDEQGFIDAYCKAHEDKFGESFEI